MKLLEIEKKLRQKIGSFFPHDVEKEKVYRAALDKIQDHKSWKKESWNTVKHNEYNIEIYYGGVSRPKDLAFPFRWKAHFREHIKIIMRNSEVERLGFIYDVISTKYIYQRKVSGSEIEEFTPWLHENAKNSQYTINDGWLYISDDVVATGFKLTFD